jgi:hypothetical protein
MTRAAKTRDDIYATSPTPAEYLRRPIMSQCVWPHVQNDHCGAASLALGVAVVHDVGEVEVSGIDVHADLLARLADCCLRDRLAVLQVPGRESARVPRFPDAHRREPAPW